MVRRKGRAHRALSPEAKSEPAASSEEEAPESDRKAAPPVNAEALPEPAADQLAAEMGEELRELEELRDRHLRLAAEFENYRKRTRREQAEHRDRAQADLARRLIDSLDDLERVASLNPESTGVQALHEGVELIYRKLRKELEEAGLETIEGEGVKFDPAIHESLLVASATTPDDDETISRVLTPGYRFRGHLLRAAQVEIRQFTGAPDHAPGSAEVVDEGVGPA